MGSLTKKKRASKTGKPRSPKPSDGSPNGMSSGTAAPDEVVARPKLRGRWTHEQYNLSSGKVDGL